MIKSKPCIIDGCKYPRWSRNSKRCKPHHQEWVRDVEGSESSLLRKKPDKKPTIKKVRQKIKHRTSKRKRQEDLYSVMRRQFLEMNPNCAVFPNKQATEVHHMMSRRGDMLLDTRHWLACSTDGHRWIHANPKEAEEKGWLIKGRNSK